VSRGPGRCACCRRRMLMAARQPRIRRE
jgi:hypothetical protein